MKKSELEEAYRELQYRYNKLHSDSRIEIENLKRENEVNLKNQQLMLKIRHMKLGS